jgi:hypothetical protein
MSEIGFGTLGVRDPARACSSVLDDECFDIVCKTCGDRLRMLISDSRGFVQLMGKVDDGETSSELSLAEGLPLPLRPFLNFNTAELNRGLRRVCSVHETVDTGFDALFEKDRGIVGSFRESSLLSFIGCDSV